MSRGLAVVVPSPCRWAEPRSARCARVVPSRPRAGRTLAEVPGFLLAVREARETSPAIPRAAWVEAGRADASNVIRATAAIVASYALRAMRRSPRGSAA